MRRPLSARWLAAALVVAAPAAGIAALGWSRGDDAAALTREAEAAVAGGRGTLARTLAARAVAADPASPAAARVLARAALLQHDGAAAEAALRRVDSNTAAIAAEAAALRGVAKPTAGLRLQAIAAARRSDPAAASLFARATTAAPHDARSWAEAGRFRLDRGDVAGALAAARAGLAADPNRPEALLLAAELTRGQYGPVAARGLYARAVARDASYPALIGEAATLGEAGEMRAMLAATRAALAQRSNDPTALYLLATLAARVGNDRLARDLLERAGPAMAARAGPALLAATLDWTGGDAEQAVARLRSLVATQPRNLVAQTMLARALAATGAARDALDVLEPLAARGDADSYVLTLAARCAEKLGDRRRAVIWLDRAAAGARGAAGPFASPDSVASADQRAMGSSRTNPSTTIPLIRALLAAGQGAKALPLAQGLSAAAPGVPAAWVLLGDALFLNDRPAPAAAAYARAANLRFDTPTMLKLAEARARAGDRAGAVQVVRLFVSQNPNSVPAMRWLAATDPAGGWIDAIRKRVGDSDPLLLAMHGGVREVEAARALAPAAVRRTP